MEDEATPTPEDLREFQESLTRSGRLAMMDVVVVAEPGALLFETTYRFENDGVADGKPMVMWFPPTSPDRPFLESTGARIWDPESDDGIPAAGTRVLMIEPDRVDDWNGVSIRARFIWREPERSDTTPLLWIPDALPTVIQGRFGVERCALPQLTVSLDTTAVRCLVAGTVDGADWPATTSPMAMRHAVFVHPDAEILEPSPSKPWSEAVRCTRGVVASSAEEPRERSMATSVLVLQLLGRAFGVPIAMRALLATKDDQRVAGGELTNVIRFEPHRDPSPITIARETARSWWGCGLRLVGPNGRQLEEALRTSVAARFVHAFFGVTVNMDAGVAHALSLTKPGEVDFVPTMALASSLVSEMTKDETKREKLREFTRERWGHLVPEREFIDWCLRNEIQVPSEFLASK
jgi:hypothetical protein